MASSFNGTMYLVVERKKMLLEIEKHVLLRAALTTIKAAPLMVLVVIGVAVAIATIAVIIL